MNPPPVTLGSKVKIDQVVGHVTAMRRDDDGDRLQIDGGDAWIRLDAVTQLLPLNWDDEEVHSQLDAIDALNKATIAAVDAKLARYQGGDPLATIRDAIDGLAPVIEAFIPPPYNATAALGVDLVKRAIDAVESAHRATGG